MSKDGISRVRSYFLTRGVPSYLLEPLRREDTSGGTTGTDDDTDTTQKAGYLTSQEADAIISAVKEVEKQRDRQSLRDIIINLTLAIISMIFLFHFVYYHFISDDKCGYSMYFIIGIFVYPGWLVFDCITGLLKRLCYRTFRVWLDE